MIPDNPADIGHNKPILLLVRPPPQNNTASSFAHRTLHIVPDNRAETSFNDLSQPQSRERCGDAPEQPQNMRLRLSTAPGEPPKYPPHSPPPTNHTPACGSQSLVTRGSHHVHPSDPHKRVVVAVRVPFFAHM